MPTLVTWATGGVVTTSLFRTRLVSTPSEYVIVHVDRDYQLTIVGRSERDYAWIMARTPSVPEPVYEAAVTQLKTLGYATDKLRRVPQQWPEDAEAVPKR